MADSSVAITAGSGTSIDTRTEGTNGNHRQVIVLGDPATNAGVAPVDATNGLSVTLTTALPAGTNAVGKLAANSGVDIGDVDVTSVTPGSGATNLGKAEDGAHTSGDVGVMALAVRQNANGPLSGADGDYEPLQTDANGHLKVNVIDALPAGTNAIGKLSANSGVDIGDVDVTSLPTTVHSADFDTGAGTDTTLAFGIAVPASGGAAVIPGDATAGLKVDLGADNDVTVTGSVTANAGTNLNTSLLALESGGNLAGAATSLAIMDDWDNGASDGASVSGDVAHDGVDAGEPLKVGGKALTAQPTAVAGNDRVNAMFDIYGRQITMNSLREMKGNQITTITSSTSETTCVTADATYKLDVYAVFVTNTSATATEVSFKDSTAGTTRFTLSVPANDMRGFCLPMDAGHVQSAANNNWTATCADSVASIVITVLFVKNL